MQWLWWLKKNEDAFQTLKCIYLLRKEWKEVFLTLLKDIIKQIINRYNHTMRVNQVNTLCI